MAKPLKAETLAKAAKRRGYWVPQWQHDKIAATERTKASTPETPIPAVAAEKASA